MASTSSRSSSWRALTPADFGLTALAGSVIAVLDTVLEIPLSQALTRLASVD